MNEKLKKIISNEIIKLPKESQEVISSFGWESILKEIGKKFLLNENEIYQLQVETALILLGIAEEDLLSLNIENRVGISKEEAIKIAEEISQKIFNPMVEKRNKLIKENLQIKNQNWQQTINFIISGGDYSVFIEK